MYIAWDIETCPLPESSFSDAQKERFEKELLRRRNKDALKEPVEESKRAVCSLNACLGWICCLSVVRYDEKRQELGEPKSYAHHLQSGEGTLLQSFWSDLKKLPNNVTWITFNGKRFDVPFLLARTLAHGIQPTRKDLLNDYPYGHDPHTDLACLSAFKYKSLADVCDLLGVESPKGEMDGSGVAEAVASGNIEEVAAYCERDVRATMNCYLKSRAALV